jgi:ferredoxin
MSKLIPMVEEGHCLGYADCARVAPGVFTVDEVAVVIGEGDPGLVLAAAGACPADAIRVVNAETAEEVEP